MKNYKDADWIGHMAIRKEPDKSLVLLMKSEEKMSKDLVSFGCQVDERIQ